MPALPPSSQILLRTFLHIFEEEKKVQFIFWKTLWLADTSLTVNCRWAQNWIKSETQPRKGDICKLLKMLWNKIWKIWKFIFGEKQRSFCWRVATSFTVWLRERAKAQKWIKCETEARKLVKYGHSYSQWGKVSQNPSFLGFCPSGFRTKFKNEIVHETLICSEWINMQY